MPRKFLRYSLCLASIASLALLDTPDSTAQGLTTKTGRPQAGETDYFVRMWNQPSATKKSEQWYDDFAVTGKNGSGTQTPTVKPGDTLIHRWQRSGVAK
jgi:hypothetical protein